MVTDDDDDNDNDNDDDDDTHTHKKAICIIDTQLLIQHDLQLLSGVIV